MKHVLFAFALLCSVTAFAVPTVKYNGSLTIVPNTIHKDGVKGQVDLVFEGENLLKVDMKTEKPVFGKSQFLSAEQAIFSRTVGEAAQIAVVFKLQGTPHKWYFVYIGTTVDQGATYAGKLHKVTNTMEGITTVLTGGQTPSDWKIVGSGTLKKVTP
ncbi:MAG: hypothetical protein ABL958_11315 [Bdellovibrionia bacterium]